MKRCRDSQWRKKKLSVAQLETMLSNAGFEHWSALTEGAPRARGCLHRGHFHSLKLFQVTWTSEASAMTGQANGSIWLREVKSYCRFAAEVWTLGSAQDGTQKEAFTNLPCLVSDLLCKGKYEIVSQLYEPIIFMIKCHSCYSALL